MDFKRKVSHIAQDVTQEPLLIPKLPLNNNSSNENPKKNSSDFNCSRENLVFFATALAFYLSQNITRSELETLINLINITAEVLNAILVQRDIDSSANDVNPII